MKNRLIDLLYEGEEKCEYTDCGQCDYLGCESCGFHIIADHLIAHGVTVQEWISVKDRLPDLELVEEKANDADLYPCLVVIKHPRAKGGSFVSKCWYNGYDFLDADSCPWTFETTHWMPLPQPPKGE